MKNLSWLALHAKQTLTWLASIVMKDTNSVLHGFAMAECVFMAEPQTALASFNPYKKSFATWEVILVTWNLYYLSGASPRASG